MGRRRSASFYGEGAHQQAYGQCDVVDANVNTCTANETGVPHTTKEVQDARKPNLAEIAIPQVAESEGAAHEAEVYADPGIQTPKPIKRQATQIFKMGAHSLSVHEKVKELLNRRNSIDSSNDQGISLAAESIGRPSDARIQQFRDILHIFNYSEGPHEAIELLAKDCEWETLSQTAGQIYNFLRGREDKGLRLSHNEFELKALVDDFLIRVFERDERRVDLTSSRLS